MFFSAALNVTPEIHDMLAAIDLKGAGDDTHPLVSIYADRQSHPISRLRQIQIEMMKCYQALEDMRVRPDRYTVHDARAVSRHFRGLKNLAALEVRQARQDGVPPPGADHPMAAMLMDALYNKVRTVINEALPEHMAAAVEAGLRRGLESDPQIPWPPPGVE